MTNQQLTCPKCGHIDMVQKVSAIHSPPAKPSVPTTILMLAIPPALLLFCCSAFLTPSIFILNPEPRISEELFLMVAMFLLPCGIGVSILVGAGLITLLMRRGIASQIAHWKMAKTRWDRLYYCARDDGVFDPDEGIFIPAQQIENYIYSR